MQYQITAPMATFVGSVNDVRFYAGVGTAELDDAGARYFTERGYTIEPLADPEASYADLQAEAKALGIPASGKKDEIAARIADEKARLAAEQASAGSAATVGTSFEDIAATGSAVAAAAEGSAE
jgi:hypothetical protein